MVNKFLVFMICLTMTITLSHPWVASTVAETFPNLQEPPITLKAQGVLPKSVLAGPNYRVEQTVINDGFVNTYKLNSDYGLFTLESTVLLMIRINELNALQQMEELKKTKVYTDALKEGAKGPFKTAKGLVTHPVDTIKGVGTGIGRWFSDVGRAVVSSDPHQENVLKTAVGYAAVKRRFAFEFGVNPYTDFEPVQKSLNEIAWAGTGGGLTTTVAFAGIGKTGAVGKVVQVSATSNKMKQLVRDKSPAELEKINKKKLNEMGVPDLIAKDFLKNPYYDPQETTLLVGELESMKKVEGRAKFIFAASKANEKSVARFMRRRAHMMANYNANVALVARIVDINGVPVVKRKDGAIVGLFPLDYIAWTAALWHKENAVSESMKRLPGVTGKELWIEGWVDLVARKALESRGWIVRDNVGDKLRKK